MLTVSRNFAYLQSRKYFITNSRSIYSGRVPQLLSKASFERTGSEDTQKAGYGEKEICLLGPIDVRTPLPGNMGIPPFSMFYTTKIKPLPQPSGENCEVVQSPLPEERYQIFLAQAAIISASKSMTLNKLECVGYNCPQLLKKDFLDLFPNRDLNDNLTVITICQKTENDMMAWSEESEKEREGLEHFFKIAAGSICADLKHSQYWADFINPNSGRPQLGPVTTATMFETDSRYRHFGFNIEDMGCCKLISHHAWGTYFFVGAIFTNAPLESLEVQNILDKNSSIFLTFPDLLV